MPAQARRLGSVAFSPRSVMPLALVCAAVALAATPAPRANAQNDAGDFKPFTGVVTGDDVYVRAGASKKYYWIAKVDRGDLVKVRDERYGWYLIDAPGDTFSYISEKYVDRNEDGKTGTVTGNNVQVRAPSPKGPGRTTSYKSQTSLDAGATVTIIGKEPGWYRIIPPKGALAYISADYVRRATQADLNAAEQADAEQADADADAEADAADPTDPLPGNGVDEGEVADEGENEGGGPTNPVAGDGGAVGTGAGARDEVVSDVAETPPDAADRDEVAGDRADTPPDAADAAMAGDNETGGPTDGNVGDDIVDDGGAEAATGAGGVGDGPGSAAGATEGEAAPGNGGAMVAGRATDAALAALEARFAEVSGQPLIDQPVETLLARYQSLRSNDALSEQQAAIVGMRIELLETRRRLKETLVELKRAQTDLEAERDVDAADGEGIATAAGEDGGRGEATDYTAVGRLLASSLYTGERLPKLYRLVDPLTDMTIGYVEPAEDPALKRMLGRVVGIVGSSRYHAGLKLKLIRIDRIDPLAPQR